MVMDHRSVSLNPVEDDGAGVGELPDGPDLPAQHTLSEYEEELPVYLGLLNDLPKTPSYDLPEDELRHLPEGNKDSAWQNCFNAVEKYDRELCQTYREQIDTLLVFAGLFSAVVTAFAVESYQWLQDDAQDISAELLRDVVTLLSHNLNITAPPTPAASPSISGLVVARVNCFWFSSLSLSLSASLVGILCKQWLREFERNAGQSPERALAVRYVRFQGFEYWGVGSIVTSVPIIMQIALAFFMIGIIDLLWHLHVVVACCVTVVAGLTLVFFLTTTFIPAIQYAYICIRCCIKPLKYVTYSTTQAFTEPQCAFKSPQAWLVFRIIQPVVEYLLRTYGHHFSFRRPPHDTALVMRSSDSWVTFDLNWINRRQHIHHGPQCAFESLAWIAKNLGEMHLSSWVWHCVWARWLGNRQNWDTITSSAINIEPVVRSYPSIPPLGRDSTPRIRVQALVFQCSLRADLPIETAIELLLRIAPVVGVNSRWTREAIRTIRVIYQDIAIHINDGLAVELFRLAETQTHALILSPDGPNGATQLNAALAFKDILLIIHRGSRLREPLLLAMSGLALQWLRSNPPVQIAYVASLVFQNMLIHLGMREYDGIDWRRAPGVILAAKLAAALSHSWPEFARDRFEVDRPHHVQVMRDLLAMASDESANLSRVDLEGVEAGGVTPPHSRPVRDVDGELSAAPDVGDDVDPSSAKETHARPHELATHAGGVSEEPSQGHLCIDVHERVGTGAAKMESEANSPSLGAGPFTPRFPPGNVSPEFGAAGSGLQPQP